jgi:hypothetical protein
MFVYCVYECIATTCALVQIDMWFLTAEPRVQSRLTSCGITSGWSNPQAGVCLKHVRFFLLLIISSLVYIIISPYSFGCDVYNSSHHISLCTVLNRYTTFFKIEKSSELCPRDVYLYVGFVWFSQWTDYFAVYRVGQTQLGSFWSLKTNQTNNTRENGKVPAAAIYRQQKVLSHFPVCCWIDWLLMIKNCLIESGSPCSINRFVWLDCDLQRTDPASRRRGRPTETGQQIPDPKSWKGSNIWSNVHKMVSTPRHSDWLSAVKWLT